MALKKVSFGNFVIFSLALAEVSTWTIDLPDVRKYFFEKHEKELAEKKYDYKYKEEEKPIYYSNIEGNSKHNTKNYHDVYENTKYAREYGYESYMEKKVNDIVYNGSVYLEGLRRALENYTLLLEECGRRNTSMNSTTWRPPFEVNSTSSPPPPSPGRCREASRGSEHVRRLAALAVWAARELQDLAYTRTNEKDDDHSLRMQENELILKLAWFLDRLAHYTGYEPEPHEFLETTPGVTTSTAAPTAASVMGASPELTRLMMECLRQNSSEAAAERCRYPEPLPPLVQLMMEMNSNITGIPAMPAASSDQNQVLPMTRPDSLSEQSMELLIASDYKTPSSNTPSLTAKLTADYPSLTAVKNVQKRSVLPMLGQKEESSGNIEVSPSENDPAINFLKYYAKYKVWDGVNSKYLDSNTFQQYEVKNNLEHKISKRAIENKKFKHLKLPENPYQDLSKYIKHKNGVNYVKDEVLAEKVRLALEKMAAKPSKDLFRQLSKQFRQKRSVTYEKDVDLPRESGDPQRDISYYTKNKPGRNYNNDLVQAVQVRAGLEQVFSTGNIEVVRRYGANYNPLIPAPFFAGIMKSQADFKK